ncbi:hypothetical protein R1flu_017559 [Riccia fluitans]|uniref:E2 ubiquitin-conjugating enzyme n=1 Tax=Riccia fluitans TaxID=41844 RepID=A0ABD1ZFP8_9MARC
MQAARLATRLQRELRMLQSDPPPGVCAWPCDDSLSHLQAQIQGPHGTVYAKGVFKLEIYFPERYPFEPPSVRFKTPIYHPNIDSGGRICLDILNMPPKGAWKPSLNIPTVLASIGLLLSEPNPDDGLMGDITAQYKHDRFSFDMTATKWTEQYAMQGETALGDKSAGDTDFQQNLSLSAVNTRHSPPIAADLKSREKRQDGLAVLPQAVQTPSEARTVAANNSVKCSALSNPKLNLGNKLSLEKGARESGKQGVNEEAFSVTAKRPLASISNTVGTRQGVVEDTQPVKKTTVEKKTGKDGDIRSQDNENLNSTDGSQPLIRDKPISTLSSMELQRGRAGSAPSSTHASQTALKQQRNSAEKLNMSVTSRTSSAVARVESDYPTKKSKFFMFPSKLSRKSSTDGPKSMEETADLQDGLKEVRVASEARYSGEASDSSGQKAEASQESKRSTDASTKGTPPSTLKEDTGKKCGLGRLQTEAGPSSYLRTDIRSNSKIEERATTSSAATGASVVEVMEDEDTLDRRGGHRSTAQQASSIVQSRTDSQRKVSVSTKVDVIILPDEPDMRKRATGVPGLLRPEMAKKPPVPAKPGADVIVLDSESDEEPPKGRSRLSLARRKVIKK